MGIGEEGGEVGMRGGRREVGRRTGIYNLLDYDFEKKESIKKK